MNGDAIGEGRLPEKEPYFCRPCHLALDLDTLFQLVKIGISESAGSRNVVLLFVLVARMREFVCQLSVIRQYEKACAVLIETPRGMQSRFAPSLRQEIHHRGSTPVVLRG